jgi:twinkle protein
MATIDVAAIKAAHPIESVIERMTGQRIERNKICCPFHDDGSPSLHVYEDGGWKCFGCGLGGDVFSFVGYLRHGLQYDSSAHFIEIASSLGDLEITPQPARIAKPKAAKPTLNIGPDAVVGWHDNMPASRRAYWHSRGLTDQTISEFILGFDGQRYTIPAMWRCRVVMGVKRRKAADIDDGIDAKYTSIYGSRVGIFNSDTLLGAEYVVICEGEIDAMLLHQSGIRAVSSTGGAGSWRDKWAQHFTHIQRVFVLYDNDEAGRKGARTIQASIRRAQVLTLPDGVGDVGELFDKSADAAAWVRHTMGSGG